MYGQMYWATPLNLSIQAFVVPLPQVCKITLLAMWPAFTNKYFHEMSFLLLYIFHNQLEVIKSDFQKYT